MNVYHLNSKTHLAFDIIYNTPSSPAIEINTYKSFLVILVF